MVTRQPGHRPLVEVLYVRECPYYAVALALVERGRAELGIDTELRTSLIGDQATAEQARFPGSPTIRVDGRGVALASEPSAELSVACRLYRLDAEVCAQQPFFASAQAASRWLTDHPQGRLIPVRSFHAEARRLVDRLEATPPSHPTHVNAAGGGAMTGWRQPAAVHPRPDR
jgi:hypothetical protein